MLSVIPHFATSGEVASGLGLILGWPEAEEFDRITELRNHASVAKWFLDSRQLDRDTNRNWLRWGMRRGEEGLLSIRWSDNGEFLGTIGWSGWNRERRAACFGRLMLDRRVLAQVGNRVPLGHPGIAVAAATLLRDYAFETMGLYDLTTWHFEENKLAAKVNTAIGMKFERKGVRLRPDGQCVGTIELRLIRQCWLELGSAT